MNRRTLLRGLGVGTAALATGSVFLTGTRAGATKAPPPQAATLAGLHGATLLRSVFPSGTTWSTAISTWEGYTGTTVGAAKVYYLPGAFPTALSGKINTYIAQGIKALLAFKPAFNPPRKTHLDALQNALKMFQDAGLNATVTLWPEPASFMLPAQFNGVIQYYGPMVRNYYPLAYDVLGFAGPQNWTSYYPGDSFIDVIAIDYYANSYVQGFTLDVIAGIADSANPPKPFGIWEMGNSADNSNPGKTEMQGYFNYIQSYMTGRLQAGKPNAELVWYNGHGMNTIRSSSDYRVPLWDKLVTATS